jgi:hypothetical protein
MGGRFHFEAAEKRVEGRQEELNVSTPGGPVPILANPDEGD